MEEKGRGKAKEHCENPGSVKEDNQSVWQGKPEQCENLNKEDSEMVWQLEKEAADAIARAAAAVSGEIEDGAADFLNFKFIDRSCGRPSAC